MRLLELNTESTWRGGERQTFYQIKGFLQSGLDVELLCKKGKPLAQKVKPLGIKVIEIGNNLEALRFLCSIRSRYDILHAQSAKTQSLAILAKGFHSTPVVYTRRVDFVPSGKFSNWKYRNTDKIVAISNAIRDILNRSGLNNIDVIPSIVLKRQLSETRAEDFLKKFVFDGKKIIATTSAFVPHKDPLTMVHAIEELRKLRKDFVFLHFGNGPLRSQVEQYVSQKKLETVYFFMDYQNDVEDFFSRFNVFVMSSQEEGLGSSVLDAFVYGVPVVSTNAGGLKELVTGRGIVCEIKDSQCLANGINRILDDESLRKNNIIKAEKDAKELYALEPLTKKYLDIFNSILST